MKLRYLTVPPFVLSLLACVGGATLGTNEAGGDGWLDHEDPGTEAEELRGDGHCAWTGRPYVGLSQERAYALLNESDAGDCEDLTTSVVPDRKTVWGLLPGDTVPELMLDVTGHEDVRLLDTEAGLLLMGQVEEEREALYLLDHGSLDVLAQREVDAYYWGTRTAPSRDYVVVADNSQPLTPLTVIDPATLLTAPLFDLDGWGEAMWAQHSDRLAAISWTSEDFDTARLRVWDFDDCNLEPGEGTGGHALQMPEPMMELSIDASPLIGFGFTWIGWHPDGEVVVFPVVDAAGDHELVLLDVTDGSLRHVPDAAGPVSFTPDGSTLVAWDPDRDTELVLIDADTLEAERFPLTLEGTPEYFVSHDGNQVVVADAGGEDQLQIIDLDTGASVTLDTRLPLSRITVRDGHDEVYAVDEGLWRIDLLEATVDEVPLDWQPDNVVWMPKSDLLYLDDAQRPRMMLWDPTLGATLTAVDLPGSQVSPVALRDLSRVPTPRRVDPLRSLVGLR